MHLSTHGTDQRTAAVGRRPRPALGRLLWACLLLCVLLSSAAAKADAAVAYRSKTCNQVEDVTTLTLAKPAGTAAGDLLLATVGYATTATASAPAGWTQAPGLRGSVAGSHQLVTWYKLAGASEPASYAFTAAGSADAISGSLTAFTGVSGGDPIAGTPGQTIHSSLATVFTLPDSSGTRAGSMRVSSISHDDVGDSTYSGGMTELCDNNTANGQDISFSAAYQTTGVGTTASRTVTLTDNGHAVTHTVVLNAAVPPTVGGLSPSAGPTAGGTVVTITGADFTGATAVTFGGVPGTALTVVDDSTITVTTPAGAAGTAEVRVDTPAGTSADAGAADDYTYYAVPTITAIAPAAGPVAGGTLVTITGTNFGGLSGAAAVRFGTTNASGYTVVNATTITATAPAGTSTQDVRVTTPGGTTANTAADNYTYYAVPTITSIAPTQGPEAGGTSVTITGTNFGGLSGAAAVRFGTTNASSYTVVNATTITATAPAGTGTQDVRVTTPGGTTANTAADNYTYVPLPTITSIAPATGPVAGGTSVTITGTNLTGATLVRFGATNATGYTVVNATTITATAPAGTGTQDVQVTTPGGATANTAADDYTYLPVPTITALAPTQGPEAGGTSVTITGTGFTGLSGAAAVRFGTTNASSYTVVNATTITATAPAGTGTQDVRVTTPGGTTANTAADDYTYFALPTITSIAPIQGPEAGGTTVTITGTNFAGLSGAAAVRFGTTNATGYTVVNATTITATAPAGTGTQDVRVTTPGGTTANTAADNYTYVPLPTITAIAPTQGPPAGGTLVTITGTNFAGLSGAAAVRFGSTNATSYTVVSSTTITATAPAGTGVQDVRVTTPGGTSANTAADDYTYVAAPSVTGVSPASGPVAGGTSVTITGTGFTGATSVTFGGTPATGYTVVNATTITATVPAHAAGLVDVRVTAPGGLSANTAADDYLYLALPTLTGLSPTQGPDAGGTSVTLTGTGFTGATAVQFGATPALGYTVVNATTITATAPPHAAGTVDVRVTAPGGTTANTAGDDFTFLAVCASGGLSVTPNDILFAPFMLDGFDKTRTTTTTVGVSDMTGAGAGWKLEVGTEQFSAGPGKLLPPDAAEITDAVATPLGGNCSAPTRALSTYPVPLPISPSKERVYNAAAGTGKGPVDVRLDVALHVPGNVAPGTYVSTWTYDLSAAP